MASDADSWAPEREDPVYETAVRLLARREHARAELARKLAERGFDDGATQAALDRLESQHYLSDERFAGQFVRERSQRGQGPLKLRAELYRRGLDEAVIDRAIEAAEADWWALAREVRQRRFGDDRPAPRDQRERARQARFLEQRGFSAAQVRAALNDEEL